MNKFNSHYAKADNVMLMLTVTLLILGFVIMASASSSIAESPFYYVNKQAIAMGIGILAGWTAFNVPYALWYRHRGLIFIAVLIALSAVLIFGEYIRGARRWITIGGMSLQVIEFVKVAMVLYIAGYLAHHRLSIQLSFWRLCGMFFVTFIVIGLAMLQPDFGNSMVIVATVVIMAFMAGARLVWLGTLFCFVVALVAVIIWVEPYRLERVSSFLEGIRNPLADTQDSGYQRIRSLSAIARGGFTGQGLGGSLFKHDKLPFAHSDFIFSIYAEELGLIGIILLMFLLGLFVLRAFQIGLRAESVQRYFVANVCFGIGAIFAVQWIFNMGVCLSLLPTKGMALPFFSVGGSSLMASLIAVGILARAKYEVDIMEDATQSDWFDELHEYEPHQANQSMQDDQAQYRWREGPAYDDREAQDIAILGGNPDKEEGLPFDDRPTALERWRMR